MKRAMTCVLAAALALGAAGVADANTIASSTMWFQGALTQQGSGYVGTVYCVDEAALGIGDGVSGFDIYGKEGATAWFGDMVAGSEVWTPQLIGSSHDAWPAPQWTPDTPDWYQYSLEFSFDGTTYRWALRNHAGATAADPWNTIPCGVPMSGVMDWGSMFATETDLGAYLSGTGTPEIAGGAAAHGGGAGAWDMDWSWGSEVVPLEYPGFAVTMTPLATSGEWMVKLTPAPEPATIALLASGVLGLVGLRRKRRVV